jgi:hypothetical protein
MEPFSKDQAFSTKPAIESTRRFLAVLASRACSAGTTPRWDPVSTTARKAVRHERGAIIVGLFGLAIFVIDWAARPDIH